jgi:hypothetical protein
VRRRFDERAIAGQVQSRATQRELVDVFVEKLRPIEPKRFADARKLEDVDALLARF